MQKYILTLESLRYAISTQLKAKQLATRFKVTEAELADFMIQNKMYFECIGLTAKRLIDLGFTFKQLVAEYGYDFGTLYRIIYAKNDDFYVGKTVNYLKINGFVTKNKAKQADCTCICGKQVFLARHAVLSGGTKSCGCLGTGRRAKNALPTKNESLYDHKKQLFMSLVKDGVIFNTQSKIISKILKGETDADKIAMECNSELNYVYHTARDFDLAHKINKTQIDKTKRMNKEKTKRVCDMVASGCGVLEACDIVGIPHSTYKAYKDANSAA
jgi:hypothetical protein